MWRLFQVKGIGCPLKEVPRKILENYRYLWEGCKMKRITFLAIIAILVAFPVAAFAHSVAQPAESPSMAAPGAMPQAIPTFVITDVVQDTSVTIQTDNFPASDTFEVHMNFYGTQGIGGTIVDTINTGAGGRLTETFSIPAVFHGQYKIAIRLESTTSAYYAYNWFYNNSTNGGSTGGGSIPPGYSGYPTFGIADVTADQDVTITGLNFPAGDTFDVRMNYYGTLGVAGQIVETITIQPDGSLPDSKYDIPAFLHGEYKIAIRLQSPTSGYYAYNWFYNNTSGSTGGGTIPATYTGHPAFWIAAVSQNQSVQITPSNFIPNDTYNVRMNYYGTGGYAGTVVETVTAAADGSLPDLVYAIPPFLNGQYKIAIRLESPTTGYYAYNWFYNNTTSPPAPAP